MSVMLTELTPRETQVARIIGRGYSDRRAAQVLGLSVRTVEVHVRHVYEKLMLASRDELIDRYQAGTL